MKTASIFSHLPSGTGIIVAVLMKTDRENEGSPESVFNIIPLLSITYPLAVLVLAAFIFKAAKTATRSTRGRGSKWLGGLELEVA